MRYAAFKRQPARPNRSGARKIQSKQFPAPIRGWIANENLSMAGPAGALVLDNFFPTATGIKPRGGSRKHATLGSDPVESMFTYRSGGTQTFFAADEENVFEISAPADPDTPPVADITGQTSGYYSAAPFTTSGGDFLYILNGTDDPQLYDGSSWTAINSGSSPVSITNVTASDLSQAWPYRNRLFFVEGGTMNVWYPAVGALGGALSVLTLQGVYKRGGAVLFGSTWSLDAGDGVDDKCVIVSTEGEVAVFEGSNPSSASEWNLVGVYNVSRPLGKNAWTTIGGDLLLLTEEGIVPISAAINKDPTALSLAAVTVAIEPKWKEAVRARKFRPWEMIKWPEQNKAIINVPRFSDADAAISFVANMETGAWCRYTGWDTRCLGIYNEWVYFGTNEGTVIQTEIAGNDDGAVYTASYVGQFDHLGSPGYYKSVHQARATFITDNAIIPQISVSTNYAIELPAPPSSIDDYTTDLWDVGLWDVALWDSGTELSPSTRWRSIGRSGFAFAPQIQMSFGISAVPDVELVAFDMTFEGGELVVAG